MEDGAGFHQGCSHDHTKHGFCREIECHRGTLFINLQPSYLAFSWLDLAWFVQGNLDFEFGKVRLGTSASTGPLGPTGGIKKKGIKKETTGSLLKKVRGMGLVGKRGASRLE